MLAKRQPVEEARVALQQQSSIEGDAAELLSGCGEMAQDGRWARYDAPEYGFSMLIPEGASVEEKEEGSWGALYATYQGVEVLGYARLGEPEEIEAFGVKETGISADRWEQIDSGEGDGWKWYRTVQATSGDKTVFGGYGVGPKGSYLILLRTTPADFEAHRADYAEWYESVELR